MSLQDKAQIHTDSTRFSLVGFLLYIKVGNKMTWPRYDCRHNFFPIEILCTHQVTISSITTKSCNKLGLALSSSVTLASCIHKRIETLQASLCDVTQSVTHGSSAWVKWLTKYKSYHVRAFGAHTTGLPITSELYVCFRLVPDISNYCYG